MLLNALCCSLYERNYVCAVTKIFTRKQFLPTSAGNAQAQLHFRDDQQRAFGISNISNCTKHQIVFTSFTHLLMCEMKSGGVIWVWGVVKDYGGGGLVKSHDFPFIHFINITRYMLQTCYVDMLIIISLHNQLFI